MSKINKTGRSKCDARHVRLYASMTKAKAWRGLSLAARCAWLEFALVYDGKNNGRLAVSSRELAERLGVSKTTAQRAIIELENAGFLRMTKASSFSIKRTAAEYRLTHLKCDVTGALPSKEFAQRDDSDHGNILPFPATAE